MVDKDGLAHQNVSTELPAFIRIRRTHDVCQVSLRSGALVEAGEY